MEGTDQSGTGRGRGSRKRSRLFVAILAAASVLAAIPATAVPGVPPEITSIVSADQDIDPGETRSYDVTVVGYDTGGTFTFSGSGLTATVTRARNDLVRLSVVAASNAEAGMRDLTVTNPDGLAHTFADAITVNGTNPPPVTGDVTGHVFEDLDEDGALDTGEPGIAGVAVAITDAAATQHATTTDANGDFTITGVAEGTASVTVTAPVGFALTTGNGVQSVEVVEGLVAAGAVGYAAVSVEGAPNFVVIVTDDQRFDTIGRCTPQIDALDMAAGPDACMPELQEHLAPAGTVFYKGEVTQSLCCPSRASILSGQYSTTHGVTNLQGEDFDDTSTLATWLDDVGYRTGMFGKYLNGYGEGPLAEHIPPGWDTFEAFHGPNGFDDPFTDYPWISWESGDAAPVLSELEDVNSTTEDACAEGNLYSTDYMCWLASEFIAADTTQPFFAYIASAAPHSPNTPADRHVGLFPNVDLAIYPDFDELPSPNPPSYLPTEPLGDRGASRLKTQLRTTLISVLPVDDMIGVLHDQLAADGRLANTVWIFISDNGFARGEHRWGGKKCGYWICHRVPFVVVCPPAVCAGATPGATDHDNYALNIDIAPTIADLAGATPGIPVDGQSLVPILEDPAAPWRTEWFLHENDPLLHGIVAVAADGDWYKYVAYSWTAETEMYNLTNDAYELANLVGDPAYAAVEAELAARLDAHVNG